MIGHLDAGLPRLLAALLVRLLRALLVRDLVADLARDVHTHLHHPRVTTRALKVFSCSVQYELKNICSQSSDYPKYGIRHTQSQPFKRRF